ncbi:hypothetical protein FGRMN_6845 [Fusarium graminum]|nr:hypothetical protein FGRMN_6845 [Fusarium graminum]
MAPSRIQPQGALTHKLVVKEIFNRLSDQDKLYAHYLSQAAWYGARVIMAQVSPESNDIFDFIIKLYDSCAGNWETLIEKCGINNQDLAAFLDYAGLFLTDIGNYHSDGGAKIVPAVSLEACTKLASVSPETSVLFEKVATAMFSPTPSALGYPGDNLQAAYYPGPDKITRDEIAVVGKILEEYGIEPENTRIVKGVSGENPSFDVLVASSASKVIREWADFDEHGTVIRLVGGDHSREMSRISELLLKAKDFTASDKQARIIDHYAESFQTGSLQAFRESQKLWVTDKSPSVETIIGFVEPYRDPHGVRGEWEAMICISDPVESERLKKLVEKWDVFIRQLPWAVAGVNDGKGPFEKTLFDPPDFASVHSLASCASIIWNGINLPNYNDIRETVGFKNIVVTNRMAVENDPSSPCHFVQESEVNRFKACVGIVGTITTAVHELLGHGSGKLLSETSPGQYNFDHENPPTNPLTGEQVKTWYLPGQTWTGLFGEIAPSVEECRAEAMSLYLMDNKELLSMYGYDDSTDITADDLHYITYLHIGVQGLQALEFFNAEERAWGEAAHRSSQWVILKHLIQHGDGVITIVHDEQAGSLHVKVNRDKLSSHGQPALGDLLCRIQIWRCIADFASCSVFYQALMEIDGEEEKWRQVVRSKPEPRWKFVQPNTVLVGDTVELKEYDESNEGIIQSWAERHV